MDQIGAAHLQVNALAGRVRADENAQRLDGRIAIERLFDLFAAILACGPRESGNPTVRAICVGECLIELRLQPTPRVFPLGENDQAAGVPSAACEQVRADPVDQPRDASVWTVLVSLGHDQHGVDRSQLSQQLLACCPHRAHDRSGIGEGGVGARICGFCFRFGVCSVVIDIRIWLAQDEFQRRDRGNPG